MDKLSILNGKIVTKNSSLVKFVEKFFNIGSGFDWMVLAIAIDKNDKIYLGGNFTDYNGQIANRIIRLNPDGTKDTGFDNSVGFDDNVRTIFIDEDTDKIYVGGAFTSYKGQTENRIIRLNPDGTKDIGFDNSIGFNEDVVCIIKNPLTSEIFVGGSFTTYKGQTNNCIIKLSANGSKDETFDNSIGFGAAVGPNVSSILFAENKLYVGGNFTTYKSVNNNRIIRLNLNGSKDTAFINGTGFDNSIQTIIAAPNNHIYAGGIFSSYKGSATNKLIRINNIGTKDSTFNGGSFNSNILGLLSTIEDSQHKLYVAGAFAPGCIAKLNSDGSRDTQAIDNNDGFDFETWTIAQDSKKRILIGGLFTTYKNENFNRILRLNLDGSINTKTF